MSRGFVKEEDQEATPIIPPRAPLPDGVPNYVTPQGLNQLQAEKETLEEELKKLHQLDAGPEKRYEIGMAQGKLDLLMDHTFIGIWFCMGWPFLF